MYSGRFIYPARKSLGMRQTPRAFGCGSGRGGGGGGGNDTGVCVGGGGGWWAEEPSCASTSTHPLIRAHRLSLCFDGTERGFLDGVLLAAPTLSEAEQKPDPGRPGSLSPASCLRF